jgi:hypothetical protein
MCINSQYQSFLAKLNLVGVATLLFYIYIYVPCRFHIPDVAFRLRHLPTDPSQLTDRSRSESQLGLRHPNTKLNRTSTVKKITDFHIPSRDVPITKLSLTGNN